ncbi:hypothetical protein [Bradyrhizobium lablabi]|uniref:hypothetical protein n=1 Tax=Bradyrhizobium lablabi TaxID=722472 RepID=UPI0012ABB79F|nr:hypothetical protein [Bradyrhizobium lablabi]
MAATLYEGLESAPAASSSAEAGNPASIAAFVDGQLGGAERDTFASALARQPSIRADAQSAADLVYSITDSPKQVPKHLMARAAVQFAPDPPRPAEARSRWSFSFAALLPRQRLALAMVAAVALIVAVPAGLMVGGRLGGPGGGAEPELSAVPEPDPATQQLEACKDKSKDASKAAKAKTAASPQSKDAASDAKDPCNPPVPDPNSAAKK